MHRLARVCACALSLLVAFELMAAQLLQPPTLMPTEKACLAYLQDLRNVQLPRLVQLTESIRSPQEADDAVAYLAGYLRGRAESFSQLPMESLTPALPQHLPRHRHPQGRRTPRKLLL